MKIIFRWQTLLNKIVTKNIGKNPNDNQIDDNSYNFIGNIESGNKI